MLITARKKRGGAHERSRVSVIKVCTQAASRKSVLASSFQAIREAFVN